MRSPAAGTAATAIGSGSYALTEEQSFMQIFAIVVSFALTVAALALLVPAVRRMLGVIRAGQPAPGSHRQPRSGAP